MFDIFEYLIKLARNLKYIKNPCEKCLVKVTCSQKPKCDFFDNHYKFKKSWENTKEEFAELFFIFSFFGGMAFVVVTIVFGLWKWFEIGYNYFT